MKRPFNRLYIHVPFCSSKCGYCAFYSQPQADNSVVEHYLAKLAEKFETNSGKCGKLKSIFFGGGTPTWLNSNQLEKLFTLINDQFKIDTDAEISIECNPETLTSERMKVIESFCNRLSLGVQSFNSDLRQILQRQGDVQSIFKAMDIIHSSNILNFGVDLMYGIPTQSVADWEEDLKQATDLGIKHLSAYALTIEEGTVLAGHNINEDELNDISVDMWNLTKTVLEEYDLIRYEVSNYAQRDYECQHNLDIWFGDTYLGCGPAASSFDGEKRWTQIADISKWISGETPEYDIIDPESRAREVLVMGLRTIRGWHKDKFIHRTGFSWDLWQNNIEELIKNGLLREKGNILSPTEKGLLFWDEIGMELI